MFMGMAEALSCIHEKNVIHCDLSPDNIFLDSQGRAKIGDFGLAEVLKDGNNFISCESKGKLPYHAPELAKDGENMIVEFSKATDVYALGLVMLQIIYPSNTTMEVQLLFDGVRKGIFPEANDKANERMHTVIKKMLCCNPADRPIASEIVGDYMS